MIIEKFLDHVKSNPQKIAFIYYKKKKIVNKTYQEVYVDMLKVIDYLKNHQIEKQSKLLIFMKPSYEFYLILLSGIYQHYQMIVIDSFKDKEKLKRMLSLANPSYVIVNDQTKIIKNIIKPLRKIKALNISKYGYLKAIDSTLNYNLIDPVLITFTSGSTGYPKLIKRTIKDLENQYQLILKTIDNVEETDKVLALSPIYVLANLVFGVTSLLFSNNLKSKKNIKLLEKIIKESNINTINASISKYLAFKTPQPQITKAYSGGSLISLKDAYVIKNLFPNAFFTYVYGASEVVLMSKTTLDDYIQNLLQEKICIGKIVNDINIKIDKPDENGVGEIVVSGDIVLSNNDTNHHTGDIGYIENSQVFLKGRKKMSSHAYYNYELEMRVLKNFKNVKKVAFFENNNEFYLVYEAKNDLKKKLSEYLHFNINIIRIKKMPIDIRHHYKIDYQKLKDLVLKVKE